MFIAMPMAVPIAHTIMINRPSLVPDSYMPICIAAVISGGVFGDHASPLTDCTILSAFSASCEIVDHVRTQLPYAMLVAFVSVAFGLIPTTLGSLPSWLCLLLGSSVILITLLLFGKSVDKEYSRTDALSHLLRQEDK